MHDFEKLIPHMKRAGLIATVTAAIITAKFGLAQGEDLIAGTCLAILLALATFTVGYALVAARRAFLARKWDVAGLAVVLFVAAAGVELLSHFGFTAANRIATMNQASMQTTSYKDARSDVSQLETELKVLTDNRLAMQPARMPSQATAVIESAKAHKYWGLTKECTGTLGPKTRRFCDDFRGAEADLALWEQIAVQDKRIGDKRAELAAAKGTASQETIGTSAADSQGLVLASVLGGTETPDPSTQYWSGLGVVGIISLFAALMGCVGNYIAYAFDPVAPSIRRVAESIAEEAKTTADHLRIRDLSFPEPQAPSPNRVTVIRDIGGMIATRCPATFQPLMHQVRTA